MDTMAGKAKMREISRVETKLLTVIVKQPLIQKLKPIGRGKFNHLISTLIVINK